MSDRKSQKPSLEDVLRLKRLEQPPAEFWSQFGEDLRSKQLAAIVAKRPWWHGAFRSVGVFTRHPVAAGAAAALVIGAFSIGEFTGNDTSVRRDAADNAASAVALPMAGAQSEAAPPAAAHTAPSVAEAERTGARGSRHTAVKRNAVESSASDLETMMPPGLSERLAASLASRDETMQIERNDRMGAPAERGLASISLAAVQAPAVDNMRSPLAFSQVFQSPVTSDNDQEPLARMVTPSDERRSQLVGAAAAAQMASFDATPASPSDHFASRLPDDKVYESISRYSSDGDRLSIKF